MAGFFTHFDMHDLPDLGVLKAACLFFIEIQIAQCFFVENKNLKQNLHLNMSKASSA